MRFSSQISQFVIRAPQDGVEPSERLAIRTQVDGRILPKAESHPLNKCCITRIAADCLAKLYCTTRYRYLWAVDPHRLAPSVACRDEALLRGGRQRHALSTWLAIGTSREPRELLGLVNFRPIVGKPEARGMQEWSLGIAEAMIRPPDDWLSHIPLVDERYLQAFSTAIVPKGFWRSLESAGPELARIPCVPYASQWLISGFCAQLGVYMAGLQLFLPEKGYTRVEGPFTISCVAADVERRQTEADHEQESCDEATAYDPEEPRYEIIAPGDVEAERRRAIDRHEADCCAQGPMRQKPIGSFQLFDVRGATFPTIAETLPLILADPWRANVRGRRIEHPKVSPVHYHFVEGESEVSIQDFGRLLDSYITSRIPVLLQVDMALIESAIALADRRGAKAWIEERVEDPAEWMEAAGRPQRQPVDPLYSPLENVHCVVVIAGKGLLGNPRHARVLFHCPLFGPYRTARLEDLFLAAQLPFLGYEKIDKEKYGRDRMPPQLHMIAPVPHYVRFDPLALKDSISDDFGSGMDNPFVLPRSKWASWRVRLIHRKKVWNSYFGTASIATGAKWRADYAIRPAERHIEQLLPNPGARTAIDDQVLCLEVYRTKRDASRNMPNTVYFAYVGPRQETTPASFRGGFGVDYSRGWADVALFRVKKTGALDFVNVFWPLDAVKAVLAS